MGVHRWDFLRPYSCTCPGPAERSPLFLREPSGDAGRACRWRAASGPGPTGLAPLLLACVYTSCMLPHRLVLALTLLLSTTATAVTVPLKSLLTSHAQNNGQMTYDANTFFVSEYTREGRNLLLGVSQRSTTQAGRVNRVSVVAQREYLTPTERGLFNRTVVDVALKCFNLRPERKAAIVAWMNVQNASVYRDVNAEFGPMNLRFSRSLNDDGNYWTAVALSRSGTPGVLPWGNYCTP